MNLTEKLKKSQQKPRRGRGKQAFLARKNEIAQAIADGYAVKEVWEFLFDQGTIPIQYRTFTDYVNRFVLNIDTQAKKAGANKEPDPITNKVNEASKESEPKKKKEDLTRRFEYDAQGKSAEDLI